jgi:hypothetical protein
MEILPFYKLLKETKMSTIDFQPFANSDWNEFSGAEGDAQIFRLDVPVMDGRTYTELAIIVSDIGVDFCFIGEDANGDLVIVDAVMDIENDIPECIRMAQLVNIFTMTLKNFKELGYAVTFN